MLLGQNPKPFTKLCPCPITPLSNIICLAFGMLKQSRSVPQAATVTCGRHGSAPSCFQRPLQLPPPPPPKTTLTTLKSAVAMHILFYKSLCKFQIMWNSIRSWKKRKNDYYPLEHSLGHKKINWVSIRKEVGKRVKKNNVKEILRSNCILHSVYLTRL